MEEDKKEEKKEVKGNIKSLSLWIGIICLIILAVQIVLNLLGVQYEIKVVIEVVSYALALLVSMGLLNSNLKGKTVNEIKEAIKNEIDETVSNNEDIK